MNGDIKICQSITRNLCQIEVVELFKQYYKDSGSLLFGATTDIDNLGFYSAKNGRAKTQNLVDLYTNAIIYIISDFRFSEKSIIELICIPAGEEITILGIGKDGSVIIEFFSKLESEIFNLVKRSELLSPEMTAISLGYKIFKNDSINGMIKTFVEENNDLEDISAAKLYYKILLEIRELITPEVDKKKFEELNLISDKHRILFRNYIYYKLIQYKSETRNDLIALSNNGLTNNIAEEFEILTNEYGLDDQKYFLVEKLFKQYLGN